MKLSVRLSAVLVTSLLCACICSPLYLERAAHAASTAPDNNSGRARTTGSPQSDMVVIPGPLRSFLRIAGISQKVSSEDVLPLLAYNSYVYGYQGSSPTEFLILIDRYVRQARELQTLAGATSTIRVKGCDDAGPLMQILGYRMREGCGTKAFALETENPERAFLTIDSGFPLSELEEALQKGQSFSYAYPASQLPVIFHERDWSGLQTGKRLTSGSLLNILLAEPSVARLYWALAKEDVETRQVLQHSIGLNNLLQVAPVLNFYGDQIWIRSGRVVVPGGASAEAGWKELVGVSPDSPGEFVMHLLTKDRGWLAVYFDALSRLSQTQQAHFTESPGMKQLYDIFRAGDTNTTAVKGVFPRAPDLMVLFSRVQWDTNGEPHVPGNLAVWKDILLQKNSSKVVRDWVSRAHSWDRPYQVLAAMTALTSVYNESGPLQVYLMLSELDRGRQPGSRLSAETVRMMADGYAKYNSWYLVFTEFPDLNDASIARFINVADEIDKTPNQILRANELGAFQAMVGLWQILARQGQIPKSELNASWQKVIDPYATISTSPELFDGTRNSLQALVLAAGGHANSSQDEVVDLLVGPHQDSPDGQQVHTAMAGRINAVLEDQRLVSLDTLFALNDGLKEMEQGKGNASTLLPLAAELREFDLPRPIFTNSEKISWAPAIYVNHHAELQVKTDLAKVIKAPGTPAQLEAARGQLAPFLRDALVGLNYAYYEPPGSQVIHHNPLLVRSHDFLGVSVQGADRLWGAPTLLGAGLPAGGGGYLMGSLAGLSYALASTEEDFIVPENVQALIWKETVPNLLVSATLPRWWNVTPNELHAVTLYQRSGEELLVASAGNAEIRAKVLVILGDCMSPQRLEQVEKALPNEEDVVFMLPQILPVESTYLAAEYRRRYPNEAVSWGPASRQLEDMRQKYPAEVSWDRLSSDFGVPHPTLARSNVRELLNIKPVPSFAGYSSRMFGESWESSNLYWARLTDEMGYSPVVLNMLVPVLTRHMIAKIFATDLEDWPALLRAMQETGQDFRQGKIAAIPPANAIPVSALTSPVGSAQ